MKVKTFETLTEISGNDGKILLFDETKGKIGASTETVQAIVSNETAEKFEQKADKVNVYSKAEIDTKLADVGGFIVAEAGEDGKPDVKKPNNKMIYLIKVGEDVKDAYEEWIWTSEDGVEKWACIGETTLDLWDYLKTADLMGNIVIDAGENNLKIVKEYDADDPEKVVSITVTTKDVNCSSDDTSFVFGDGCVATSDSVAMGLNTSAIGAGSYAEGEHTLARGARSHAEGINTEANGMADHVEGIGGISNEGGLNHIEGFQYHNYISNGPGSNWDGETTVEFYNMSNFSILGGTSTLYGSLYELVKAFTDKFMVMCEYGTSHEYHYGSSGSFYKPKLYNVVDVSLDEERNYVLLTLDHPIDCPMYHGSSTGSINLLGPTNIASITGNGSSLTSGQILKKFTLSSLGFSGNNLENVRPDNCFISMNASYTKVGETMTTYIYKLMKLSDIEFDEETETFMLTTEESIEIPEIQGGGYSFTVYLVDSGCYGCNHIEGADNQYIGAGISHVEGRENSIRGSYFAHAEGNQTSAISTCAHSEGYATRASYNAHAEGCRTSAEGQYSHSEGYGTYANAHAAHVEGSATTANGKYSHSEGYGTLVNGIGSHAEGSATTANAPCSHAEGYDTKTDGNYSHAEGEGTRAIGSDSHAEGYQTTADGSDSHAEGVWTHAYGGSDHAEGQGTTAAQGCAHAEGYYTSALAYGHAEGYFAKANYCAHAEGYDTTAFGQYSHAGGWRAGTSGDYTFVHGVGVSSNKPNQFVIGKYNVNYENDVFEIGYGTENNRKTIFRVDVSGNVSAAGTFTPNVDMRS